MLFGNSRKNKNQLDALQNEIMKLSSEVDRTKRILKYAKGKEINFVLDNEIVFRDCYLGTYDEVCNLFIYIDNEEYLITLKELNNQYINDCNLIVKNGLAYFTCKAQRGNGYKFKYEFIINYDKSNYVVANASIVEDEPSNENKEQ